MAFTIKYYGKAPQWGVAFEKSPVSSSAAIITSASFSTSSQKYETVGLLGQKIGALVYDSECSFSLQCTLLASVDGASGTAPTAPTMCVNAPLIEACGENCSALRNNPCGELAIVACPAWIFSAGDDQNLYPVIDSCEFSMSNTSARTATFSGTIYAF